MATTMIPIGMALPVAVKSPAAVPSPQASGPSTPTTGQIWPRGNRS